MSLNSHAASFVLGQIPAQSIAVATDNHPLQIVSLITGVVIQLLTLFINKRRNKPATKKTRTKKTQSVTS